MARPRNAHEPGEEPDERFTMANERTFLAWIRTSLALIAGGIAVHALHLQIPDQLGDAAAIVLVVLGLVAAGSGWLGWMRTERALRLGTPLRGAGFATAMTAIFLLVVLLLAVGIFVL
jgi:putative membrane protein